LKPYYEHGGITIYHGDCREILPCVWFGVDLVLTDPPYGLKRFTKGFGTTRFRGLGAETLGATWDKKPSEDLLGSVLSAGKHVVIWGANNFSLPPSESFLVWNKQQTVPNFADAELAYTNLPITAKVFTFSIHKHNATSSHEHVAQKPLKLMEWCISLAKDANVVLDPFMGSGTTLLAAKNLGRRAIGIEIEERYCEIAAKRLQQEVLPLEQAV
jgi:site-specific DNA-methyltransferase (adenine-specific)